MFIYEISYQPIRHGNKFFGAVNRGLLPFLESHSLRTPSRSWVPHRRQCSLPQWSQHSHPEDSRPQSSHRQSPHSPRVFGSMVASCHNQRSGLMLGPGTRKMSKIVCQIHDDVIKWKHFPRYWPFVWGIHRGPVNSPHKGEWRGALMFSLICVWMNGWVNSRQAGDLGRYRAHYDVTVMAVKYDWWHRCQHACQISTEWLNDLSKCLPGAPFTNME